MLQGSAPDGNNGLDNVCPKQTDVQSKNPANNKFFMEAALFRSCLS